MVFPDSSVNKESTNNAGDPDSIPGSGRSAGEGINYSFQWQLSTLGYPFLGFPMAQLVKNLPAMRETWVQSLGWEDPLEKVKDTHFSIVSQTIPWTVQSMGSQIFCVLINHTYCNSVSEFQCLSLHILLLVFNNLFLSPNMQI